MYTHLYDQMKKSTLKSRLAFSQISLTDDLRLANKSPMQRVSRL